MLNAFGSSPSTQQQSQPAANGGINYSALNGSPSTPIPSSSLAQAQQALISIYAVLPFAIFKHVIESADFPPADQERVRPPLFFLSNTLILCFSPSSSLSLKDALWSGNDSEVKTPLWKLPSWLLGAPTRARRRMCRLSVKSRNRKSSGK